MCSKKFLKTRKCQFLLEFQRSWVNCLGIPKEVCNFEIFSQTSKQRFEKFSRTHFFHFWVLLGLKSIIDGLVLCLYELNLGLSVHFYTKFITVDKNTSMTKILALPWLFGTVCLGPWCCREKRGFWLLAWIRANHHIGLWGMPICGRFWRLKSGLAIKRKDR